MSHQTEIPSQEETPPQESYGEISCPKCKSNDVTSRVVENTIYYTCLNCDHKWSVTIK